MFLQINGIYFNKSLVDLLNYVYLIFFGGEEWLIMYSYYAVSFTWVILLRSIFYFRKISGYSAVSIFTEWKQNFNQKFTRHCHTPAAFVKASWVLYWKKLKLWKKYFFPILLYYNYVIYINYFNFGP